FQEMRRGCRFPENLVGPSWTAVTQQEPVAAELQAELGGQSAHPGPVGRTRLSQGVVVADLGKVIVARVRIPALAVGQLVAYGMVIIALDALDAMLVQ